MLLSVILPTYNQEEYLGRCLDSLLAQDIPASDYEVIIVNDESTDKTLDIAREYESRHANIVVLDKKNGGTGAARNSGFDMARGKYIHFVDPDDYIAQNVYGTILKAAELHHLDITGFLFTKTKKTDWAESDTDLESLDLQSVTVMDGTSYIAENNYRNTVWWYFIKRDFMKESGLRFIEGRWMEDSILTPQLFIKAKRMARVPIDVYRYMITPNSAMTSKEPEHYHKLISDIENAALKFDEFLQDLPESTEKQLRCKQRIRTRQQSFVFFLLVRLMKSGLPLQYIPEKIARFKQIDAYPLDQFISDDFNNPAYRILTAVFNREKLMLPFMRCFRIAYHPAMRLVP